MGLAAVRLPEGVVLTCGGCHLMRKELLELRQD